MLYADLEVIIQRLPDGSHAVDMRFRAEPGDVDRELALNVPVTIDKAALLSNALDPVPYGQLLSEAVFGDQRLREAWITARASAEARDMPLRIKLRLDPSDPELHGIRWETVFDDQGVAVARSERFLLSRYLDSADMTRFKTPTRNNLLALLVVASPSNLAQFNLAPFDAPTEAARIRQALADIPAATFVTGSSGGPLTLTAVVDALRFGYSLLYLVCHGRIVKGVPYLALENEAGEVDWVPGDELAARIRDLGGEQRPALIVLASCQSVGIGDDSSVPAALGPQLARAGVAAVIGMQGNVPQAMVARMMPRFFEQLAEDGQIDRALAVARTGLRPDDPWWMPVLFLRARDGQLWRDVPAPHLVAPPPPPAALAPTPAPAARPARALWLVGALGAVALAVLASFMLLSRGNAPPVPTAAAIATSAPTRAPATVAPAIALPPTPAPSPTVAPSPTPAPPAPLANGKLMVLLSRIDAPAAAGRDLTAELEEGLRRTLESVPFSNLQLVRYDVALRSEAEAEALAKASQAAVVLWGGGSGPSPVLRVRVGDPTIFRSLPPKLDTALLRRTADVDLRLELAAPELPSPALAVLAVINVLSTAGGDTFDVLRVAALIDALQDDVTPAEPVGGGTAPKVYRYLRLYYSQPAEARPVIDAALDDDPGNPLLLVYSAILHQRLNEYEEGYEDAQAAADSVPGWATPLRLLAVDRLVKGFPEQSLALMNDVVAARPKDTYALAFRGGLHYNLSDDDAARSDLEQAIELGADTSLPYNYAAALALRQGRVEDARALLAEGALRFAAMRSFDNNFYVNLFGQENIFGLTIGAFEQLLAGQNRDAIASATRALSFDGPVVNDRLRSDMYFVLGFAECRRGDYQAAADAYNQALAIDPGYGMLYLLRAEARKNLGDGLGAIEDLNAAATSPQAERLGPTIQQAQAGELTCQNVLE